MSFDADVCAVNRVKKTKLGCVKPQALKTQEFGHRTIQWPFAVSGISQDRMSDMFHVAT